MNYSIMRNKKKPETKIEFEKIGKVKELILGFLKENAEFWEKAGELQQGLEKNNLLNKVCTVFPINSNVFEIAIEELEMEQVLIPMPDQSLTRYLYFEFPSVKKEND